MKNQSQIEALLKDARWASRILAGKDSSIDVHLSTFPGLVGGTFRAEITGITPEYFGQVEITITNTVIDPSNTFADSNTGSAGNDFQEIELLSVHDSSFDIMFRLPFEAQATEEGAAWHLMIKLANGTTEIFEIPVCRTAESNPEITSVHIASTHVKRQQQRPPVSNNKQSNIPTDSYTMEINNGELTLRLPARSPGHIPTLANGLCYVIGIWVAMMAIFYWLFDQPLDLLLVFGGMIILMIIFLVFLLFGVSYCKLNADKFTTTHTLFGLPVNWRKTSTENLDGFSTKFLAAIPVKGKTHLNYFVTAKTKKSADLFLSVRTSNQEEARLLVKRLNNYLSQNR